MALRVLRGRSQEISASFFGSESEVGFVLRGTDLQRSLQFLSHHRLILRGDAATCGFHANGVPFLTLDLYVHGSGRIKELTLLRDSDETEIHRLLGRAIPMVFLHSEKEVRTGNFKPRAGGYRLLVHVRYIREDGDRLRQ